MGGDMSGPTRAEHEQLVEAFQRFVEATQGLAKRVSVLEKQVATAQVWSLVLGQAMVKAAGLDAEEAEKAEVAT